VIVSVWTRHFENCPHRDDRNYRRCCCPKHLNWSFAGRQFRQSAKTKSWEIAARKARSVEQEYHQREFGETPKKTEPITLEKAVEAYLDDKRSQRLKDTTLTKLETIFKKQMLSWCRAAGIHLLTDFDLTYLRQWRNSWTDGSLAAKKKQERVRGFFYFCQSNGWISDNPATKLSRIKVDQKPTDYFSKEEFAKIVDATYIYDSKTVDAKEMQNNATRLRALTWLMRYSGLAIRDAVTLERSRLSAENNLFLYRAKTGVPVYLPIPPFVAEALRNIPPGPKPNPRYFFWSGNGNPKSAVSDWQRAFRKLFKIANIRHADGTSKRCFPHMLRDTFAVENLLAGIPLDQVSVLLGHSSIKTTEKHYAPFVVARQDQLVASVKQAWPSMGIEQAG
jgi:integrase/recombinase XerD